MLQAEIDDESRTDDTGEVERYLAATAQAYELAKTLPITQRLVLQVHATLLRGVRGEEKSPGEFRRSPFETIHPFLDGNGRIGRLLISILLMKRARLAMPLLYLSNYFETHSDVYYERLQGVREKGDIDAWLVFFLEAVKSQAGDAVARSRRLVEIRESYHSEAIKEWSNLARLVEIIVRNPFVTVKSVQLQLGMTNQGARNLIKSAVDRGWLRSLGTRGRGGRERWCAPAIFEVMEAPMDYTSAP